MERKTLDKQKLAKLIELYRDLWQDGADVKKTLQKVDNLIPQEVSDYIFWASIREVVSGVMWGVNRTATNEQIFNIFQILGYDII